MPALLDRPTDRPEIADGELELSVVMPCLNEERTVADLHRQSPGRPCGSTASPARSSSSITARPTAASIVAREHGARVVHQPLKGYGNALRKGFAEARGQFVLMGDCDDSYDFRELPRFVERLRGGADVVMGNRLKGEVKPGAMPWLHRWVGNPGSDLVPQPALQDRRRRHPLRHARPPQGRHRADASAHARHGTRQRDGHQEPAGEPEGRGNPDHALAGRPGPPAAPAKLPRRLAAPAVHADVQPDVHVPAAGPGAGAGRRVGHSDRRCWPATAPTKTSSARTSYSAAACWPWPAAICCCSGSSPSYSHTTSTRYSAIRGSNGLATAFTVDRGLARRLRNARRGDGGRPFPCW